MRGRPKRLQIPFLIADILDYEGNDLQTHAGHVIARDFLYLLRKRFAVTIQLLYGQCTQNGP